MTDEVHNYSRCNPGFSKMFRGNRAITELTAGIGRSLGSGAVLSKRVYDVNRRDLIKGTVAVGLASFLPTRASAQGVETTVFTGGTVLTVDADFSQAEAIAIRGNKILAVGTAAQVQSAAGDNAKIVDLGGKTVLPGFIDPHSHVVVGAVIATVMDYVGMARFATTAQVLEHLSATAAQTAPGEWIAVRNFDPVVQEGPDSLTFTELDAVSTKHPIFVLNASGHLAYANSKAFEVAEIPDDIENPPGAEFVRDGSGKLNGVMKNNVAYLMVIEKNPALANADPVEALIGLLGEWGRVGMTTVSEMALGSLTQGPGDVAILNAARQTGRLTARVRAYPNYTIGAKAWDEAGVHPGDGDEMVRIVGYKFTVDGSNQGFTGLQREPYLNSDSRGLAYMTPDELTRDAMERAKKGWRLAIHGNGDAAIDNILDTCEAMRDAGIELSKIRPRIEHCSILHDDQIVRMSELGVSASFLIGHVHYWGVAMRDDVFGEDKAKLLDRCRSVEKAGIGFTLHSDFMVTDPDPMHMIEMAVTRRTWKEPDYVLAPDERISVESAIRAVTYEAAWQLD
ncbi:MAG: amidohydrolase, partial [Rhodobacteraceae bacterium]|nr:amidohydrolase [Paracoccaceae bacterium]